MTGNNSCSGRSRGGAGGQGPPLFLNHTEALTAEKKIWGGGLPPPPLCKGWMTAHPPLLISRSGSSTVLVSTLGRRLSDKDVHKEGKHQSLMTAFLAGAKGRGREKKTQQGNGRVCRNAQKQSSYRRCPFHHLPCKLHVIDDVSHSYFH